MQEVSLGIAGLGTVAQGVLQILATNRETITQRTGVRPVVRRVASRSRKPEVDLLGAEFSTDLDTLLEDDVDIVVELIGGEEPARTLTEKALASGKGVVTANKAMIARYGNDLLRLNEGPRLGFEASVAGAIPIITTLRQALVANRFADIVGIINGTCNYILTAMESDGRAFDDVLAEAQALGYAEADPTFDVDGIDAAHKLAILTGLAFDCPFDLDGLYIEGIRDVSLADLAYAKQLGYRIKHVAIAKRRAEGIEARVHPALIPERHLLASVNDVANAVVVNSDAAGQTLFSGPGAGSLATASAVLGDVLALAGGTLKPLVASGDSAAFVPITDVKVPSYLCIPVADVPGVFADIASVLSTRSISIEAAIQKEPTGGQPHVDIVILTGSCRESDILAAIDVIEGREFVRGSLRRIRVEGMHAGDA